MKAAIFGDVGGHVDQLFTTLNDLGVDMDTAVPPSDLTLVFLGDLIHKGPGSNEIIAFINKGKKACPDQYVILLGNHECQHTNGYIFWQDCRCTPETEEIISSWWLNGEAVAVAAISHDKHPILTAKQTLLSHAGVTHQLWKMYGGSSSAKNTVKNLLKLNEDPRQLHRPGVMLGGTTSYHDVGPIWAHSTAEVYPSWAGRKMPFNQAHGHTAPYHWEFSQWFPSTSHVWRDVLEVHQDVRAVTFHPHPESAGSFAAMDPGFSEKVPTLNFIPYVLVENFKLL